MSVVYFIQSGCPVGYIKIGVARDPLRRLQNMQTHCPYPLRLVHDIPGDVDTEREIHRRFASLRHRGEWFLPGPELLEFTGLAAEKKRRFSREAWKEWTARDANARAAWLNGGAAKAAEELRAAFPSPRPLDGGGN